MKKPNKPITMTIKQLLRSKIAVQFEIEVDAVRPGVLYIHKPQFISIPYNKETIIAKMSVGIEIATNHASITLYKDSVTTHTSIF